MTLYHASNVEVRNPQIVPSNRSGLYRGEQYDLIVGPVANDNVYATIGLYMSGLMGKAAAIEELRVHRLYDQYVFCAPGILSRLQFLRMEVL